MCRKVYKRMHAYVLVHSIILDRTIMSCRVKKYASTLRVLSRAKPKVKRIVIGKADKQFMNCLCECGKNVLKGNVPLTPRQLRALRPYKNHLRDLVCKKISIKRKKIILQTSGFVGALLRPRTKLLLSLTK